MVWEEIRIHKSIQGKLESCCNYFLFISSKRRHLVFPCTLLPAGVLFQCKYRVCVCTHLNDQSWKETLKSPFSSLCFRVSPRSPDAHVDVLTPEVICIDWKIASALAAFQSVSHGSLFSCSEWPWASWRECEQRMIQLWSSNQRTSHYSSTLCLHLWWRRTDSLHAWSIHLT